MTATDLETRYGPMVSLDELAGYFHAHVRAIRNALDAQKIPILTFGSSSVVPLRQVEQSFGLESMLVDEDFIRHEAARFESTHRPDGSPKPLAEFIDEVEADTPRWEAEIEAARREMARTASR